MLILTQNKGLFNTLPETAFTISEVEQTIEGQEPEMKYLVVAWPYGVPSQPMQNPETGETIPTESKAVIELAVYENKEQAEELIQQIFDGFKKNISALEVL
jgi:hypothetical protein